ncbi:MAG: hypothetical protein F6K39_30800 [Okeania sp. SIO3B3]|nr:hypothetical protein [Okeania sp. SIO3B3]
MQKIAITPANAPAPLGPYNRAIRYGDLLFVSGQVAVDEEGNVTGDVAEQTRRILSNLGNILAEAGTDWSMVLKANVYLVDMNDFEVMNAVYAEFVGQVPPARTTVQVAGLPKGALVEIEAIAAYG